MAEILTRNEAIEFLKMFVNFHACREPVTVEDFILTSTGYALGLKVIYGGILS